MAKFMAADEGRAQALENYLSGTIFRSVKDFIEAYNAALFNKSNKDVVKIVNEILATYRNVEEKNRQLIFMTSDEVYMQEVMERLPFWNSVIRVKRELQSALQDGRLQEGEQVYVSTEKVGVFLKRGEEGYEVVTARLFGDSVAEELYGRFSSVKDDTLVADGIYAFSVNDLKDVDTSFAEALWRSIPR